MLIDDELLVYFIAIVLVIAVGLILNPYVRQGFRNSKFFDELKKELNNKEDFDDETKELSKKPTERM